MWQKNENEHMKKAILIFFLISVSLTGMAQLPALQRGEDSVLKTITTANSVEQICNAYLSIARLYTGQNDKKEIEYIDKVIFTIEQSRDRKLIANYYRKVAEQWSSFNVSERSERTLKFVDKGLQIAKESQLNTETALLLMRKAVTYRLIGNMNEAVKYNKESTDYASLSKNDSVAILCETSYGNTLIAKDENLDAFKKYMHALNLAEASKNEKSQQCYLYKKIADFYVKVGQIEKGKDYYMKGLDLSKKLNDSTTELSIYQGMIMLYVSEKDFASAREYLKILYQKGKTSAMYKQYALSAESIIIAQEDIKKLPEFIRQNKNLLTEYEKYNMFAELYRLKAVIFTVEANKDSALYYFKRSKQQLNPNDLNAVLNWNQSYAYFLEKDKKYNEAAKYVDSSLLIAKQMQSLTYQKSCYEALDSLYLKGGNKEKELSNKVLLYAIKDSLEKQQKANDVLNVEIDIENKRNEREALAKEEALRVKHNLQYMGITAFIISMFIALAALGKLKVKPWLIRALGFLSFILLFEFIILLIDHKLHALTHGEPLPILLIKIVIIAFLMPFHHWLEHKVMMYLTKHHHDTLHTA
jgi:hypothetical protein